MIFTNIYRHIKNCNEFYFRFWANCILIAGYRNGILFDLQRGRTVGVSNLFCETYNRYKERSICMIAKDSTFKNRKGYIKMLDYFITNDFGILTDNVDTFPKLSMEYDSPFLATNVIVEVNSNIETEQMFHVIEKNTNSQVQSIQINDCGHIKISHLKRISEITENSHVQCINMYTNYSTPCSTKLLSIVNENSRFRNIIFMNSPKERSIKNEEFGTAHIRYIKNEIDFTKCGNIRKELLVYNQQFFTEANSHNTCLNRKICIDANGNIKNCPAMAKSYGNIKDTTLEEAINKPGFKDLWYICKDQIDVCKDCEFRYMCTDCRCFIKDPGNIYSQPAKCTYNPYICLWKGQEGYVPVEECGTYSRETGFVPDKKRIAELNKQIWGEE